MKTIGKYQVIGLLGRGGMGAVYKVVLPVLEKVMALKLLAPQPALLALLGRDEIRRRFLAEAVTMGRLRHPHIAAVWDFEDRPDQTFFVMDYFCHNLGALIGESYDLEAPSRALSPDLAVHYTRQTLLGLHRLHQAGVIHRDVKPFNLLITDDNQIKLTDFGLSRLRGEVSSQPVRHLRIGSPYYTAPEQERDPDSVAPSADLYSVGVLMHRLLTGRLPDLDETDRPHRRLGLAPEWTDWVTRAVMPNPADRFPDAKTMLADLDRLDAAWRDRRDLICRLPSAPPSVGLAAPRTLRAAPLKASPREAPHRFDVDDLGRPRRYSRPDLGPTGDGTVTDRAAGLVWQRSGMEFPVTWPEALDYVRELNRRKWAGGVDWRLPTVDELTSLLAPPSPDDAPCIAPVFDPVQKWLWSADRRSAVAAWFVDVEIGFVGWRDDTCRLYARAVRPAR